MFTAGALAILHRADGRVLLVKPRYRTAWGFPGGFLRRADDQTVSGREQADGAVVREVLEETGVHIEHPGPVVATYVQARRKHIEHVFIVEVSDAQAEAATARCWEIEECSWHPIDEFPVLQPEAEEALAIVARELRLLNRDG